MSEYIRNDPEWKRFESRMHEDLVPMLRSSSVTAMLMPRGEPDIKVAVELGLSILLGKPIIVMVDPGGHVPDALRALALEVIEGDLGDPATAQKLQATVERLPS
jgi:hypothetical protein